MAGAFDAHPILRIRSPIIGRGEQVFELTGGVVTIGRAEDCDIVLLEQSASRVHARLIPEDGGWTLVDEDSHAGVFMGPQRVRRQRLADGDRFHIGETDFQLVQRPASQPTVIGVTRPPTATERALPGASIGTAPTMVSGAYRGHEPRDAPAPSSYSVAPLEHAPPVVHTPIGAPPPRPAPPPEPVHAPIPAAPPVAAPGPLAPPRPLAPPVQGSAPSFVDFGPVGRPGHAPADSASFSGQLVDDPSRMDHHVDSRVTSRFGTWIVVVLLFVGLSLAVIGMAYDITLSDVMSVFE